MMKSRKMYMPLGCWLTDQAGTRPGGQARLRPSWTWWPQQNHIMISMTMEFPGY